MYIDINKKHSNESNRRMLSPKNGEKEALKISKKIKNAVNLDSKISKDQVKQFQLQSGEGKSGQDAQDDIRHDQFKNKIKKDSGVVSIPLGQRLNMEFEQKVTNKLHIDHKLFMSQFPSFVNYLYNVPEKVRLKEITKQNGKNINEYSDNYITKKLQSVTKNFNQQISNARREHKGPTDHYLFQKVRRRRSQDYEQAKSIKINKMANFQFSYSEEIKYKPFNFSFNLSNYPFVTHNMPDKGSFHFKFKNKMRNNKMKRNSISNILKVDTQGHSPSMSPSRRHSILSELPMHDANAFTIEEENIPLERQESEEIKDQVLFREIDQKKFRNTLFRNLPRANRKLRAIIFVMVFQRTWQKKLLPPSNQTQTIKFSEMKQEFKLTQETLSRTCVIFETLVDQFWDESRLDRKNSDGLQAQSPVPIRFRKYFMSKREKDEAKQLEIIGEIKDKLKGFKLQLASYIGSNLTFYDHKNKEQRRKINDQLNQILEDIFISNMPDQVEKQRLDAPNKWEFSLDEQNRRYHMQNMHRFIHKKLQPKDVHKFHHSKPNLFPHPMYKGEKQKLQKAKENSMAQPKLVPQRVVDINKLQPRLFTSRSLKSMEEVKSLKSKNQRDTQQFTDDNINMTNENTTSNDIQTERNQVQKLYLHNDNQMKNMKDSVNHSNSKSSTKTAFSKSNSVLNTKSSFKTNPLLMQDYYFITNVEMRPDLIQRLQPRFIQQLRDLQIYNDQSKSDYSLSNISMNHYINKGNYLSNLMRKLNFSRDIENQLQNTNNINQIIDQTALITKNELQKQFNDLQKQLKNKNRFISTFQSSQFNLCMNSAPVFDKFSFTNNSQIINLILLKKLQNSMNDQIKRSTTESQNVEQILKEIFEKCKSQFINDEDINQTLKSSYPSHSLRSILVVKEDMKIKNPKSIEYLKQIIKDLDILTISEIRNFYQVEKEFLVSNKTSTLIQLVWQLDGSSILDQDVNKFGHRSQVERSNAMAVPSLEFLLLDNQLVTGDFMKTYSQKQSEVFLDQPTSFLNFYSDTSTDTPGQFQDQLCTKEGKNELVHNLTYQVITDPKYISNMIEEMNDTESLSHLGNQSSRPLVQSTNFKKTVINGSKVESFNEKTTYIDFRKWLGAGIEEHQVNTKLINVEFLTMKRTQESTETKQTLVRNDLIEGLQLTNDYQKHDQYSLGLLSFQPKQTSELKRKINNEVNLYKN